MDFPPVKKGAQKRNWAVGQEPPRGSLKNLLLRGVRGLCGVLRGGGGVPLDFSEGFPSN